MLRVSTLPAYLLTPQHNLTVSPLATCFPLIPVTGAPNQTMLFFCTKMSLSENSKHKLSMLHEGSFSQPYAKSLGFGCLSLCTHHTLTPPCQFQRTLVFPSSKFSAVCILRALFPLFISSFITSRYFIPKYLVFPFHIFSLLFASYIHSFLHIYYFPFLWPKKKKKPTGGKKILPILVP